MQGLSIAARGTGQQAGRHLLSGGAPVGTALVTSSDVDSRQAGGAHRRSSDPRNWRTVRRRLPARMTSGGGRVAAA